MYSTCGQNAFNNSPQYLPIACQVCGKNEIEIRKEKFCTIKHEKEHNKTALLDFIYMYIPPFYIMNFIICNKLINLNYATQEFQISGILKI